MTTSSSLYRDCARLFMVGFPGTHIDSELAALMDDGIYGAILFKRNVGSAADTAALCHALKTRAGRPFILSVDQEGGRVARLRGAPFTALPPMRELGQRGDAAQVERVGRLLAYELRALGFDWDFAPVLDVDTNPANPVIGDRSFSREAEEVARLGVALARGLEAGGVASCGKHFPGHGDTTTDSHLTLPRLPHDLERLRSVELVPFRAFAQAGLASLMTAHVLFDALDPGVPATMSQRVLQGVLREELGFDGVLVSDDLEMKAIAGHYSVEEATVQGTLAGVDLFLVCHNADVQRRAIEALVKAVESGRVSRERIAQAHRRLDALSARFAHPAEDRLALLGSPEHHALAEGLVSTFTGRDPTEVMLASR
ncbi:glycosyl hyrolase, family 3 [Myxococcus xanthus DK 1622]|uniref:Glycosyl hyrolase, family 3 n=1 Tax=Myxococcus xanthus (strain DK1622) TaxID=246197 RepID=Q1CXY4_MYXXD|nr:MULTISPECIES: beta-N-acetylhexosaminidase [Myxococcus]ABF88404.1 glycosyl hyrolase, family 3 [Myxococcus xanthus DK 1622]NOJ53349.1 beta-N-acetylhexosaminidase [Myxococcus xanthus]QPM78940.1 beta-N-acetylhexosaminidase [Myxococcus xanthus]QVW68017.1 beta-N-acetylhexosaminidase [Myxococcus xanthus DZ2]QZZ54236.1 Beta-hexosaminidase [Myxococcus xanthus]